MPKPNRKAVGVDATKPRRISAIVPASNAADQLTLSLPPLMAMQARGEIAEVIVVDDASTDDTARAASEHGAVVRAMPIQSGPAAARNAGVEASRGEILWFVDADVVAHETAARVISECFAAESITAVFGTYDERPPARNFLSQYKNLVHRYYHCASRPAVSTFWSGCGAVAREAFLAIGGFDANRHRQPSMEDVDLGYRLVDNGARIRLDTRIQGTHLKTWHLGSLLHTEIFRRALPWSRLLLARRSPDADLNVATGERVRALLSALLPSAIFAACLPGVPAWPAALALIAVGLANAQLAIFFARRRGAWFALRAVTFHQLYYLYSGTTFVYAWLESQLGRRRDAARSR